MKKTQLFGHYFFFLLESHYNNFYNTFHKKVEDPEIWCPKLF